MAAIDCYKCRVCKAPRSDPGQPEAPLVFEHFRRGESPAPEAPCPECDGPADYDFLATVTPSEVTEAGFEPYWEVHLPGGPVYVTSAKALDDHVKGLPGAQSSMFMSKSAKRAAAVCRQGSSLNPPTSRAVKEYLRYRRRHAE